MSRAIIHLDADAFFASVEQAADPRLRGRPIAVGGEKRGIIASASYEARRFGIYTPMPTSRARKLCPKLILLPGDFEKYERFSRWMFSYAYDFTPDVEVSSIDEGYFDLTQSRRPAITVAQTIQQAIRQSLKISVSEGIGVNKLVSQIASKLRKPAAFVTVPPGQETVFLHPLPNHWLPGIGPKTAQRLNAAGLARIGQIAGTPVDLLHLLLGRPALGVKEFANGIDERPIVPAREPAKSYSQQETFAEDQTDETFLEAVLRRMADHLMAKVRADAKTIRTLTVKVRYNDMAEDQAGESLTEPTDLETDLYPRLRVLLRQAWKRRVSLRLVSLKLSNLYDAFFRSELLLDAAAERHDAKLRLAQAVDQLRNERGYGSILRGHDLILREVYERKTGRKEGDRSSASPPASAEPPLRPPTTQRQLTHDTTPPPRAEHDALLLRDSPATALPRPAVSSPAPPFRYRLSSDRSVALPRTRPARPRASTYLPLCVHSYYSFLNSTLSIGAVVDQAVRHQLPTVALTDQGNLHGAVEFIQAARAAGLKPILGTELRLEAETLWLYVQNARGYTNLCRLLSQVSQAKSNGPAPPILPVLQSTATDGLLAVGTTSRCADLFPQRFYLGVVEPPRSPRASSPWPMVAVAPVHYAARDDRWKFNVVQSIRTLTLLSQEHPEKQLAGDFHFRSPAEMAERFKDRSDLLERAAEIGDRCEFDWVFGAPQFPAFATPDGSPPADFLRRLVQDGLRRRYPRSWADRRSQVEEELRIIAEVGYEEYFLVVWDILQECRRRSIDWITRGSAADSLVCYCLGISDVCPIRFDLFFRRFLNKDRMQLNKLPDIDVDFPHDRKDDVIDLIFAKYGAGHAAVVGGFSTFQARSAVADVAKVLGLSEHQARRFTEHFPWASARDLGALLEQSVECRDLPLQEEPYRSALQMAQFLDGFPRYAKMHPCGVVLSRQPMLELTPTFVSQKGYPTTHFDMDAVETIGLVKMDILAQAGLATLRDVKNMLGQRGIAIDLPTCTAANTIPDDGGAPPPHQNATGSSWMVGRDSVEPHGNGKDRPPGGPLSQSATRVGRPLDPSFPVPSNPEEPWTDPAVWDMIARGGARAVHHIESPAMINLCRQCNVRDIDGLIAVVSVIRPGAANESKKLRFTRRYQGLEPITYPDPSLEHCLRSTFGLVVYEEHILQICEAFAGLPAGRADILRRALGKLKRSVIEEIKLEFFAAARQRGQAEDRIEAVWELVSGFAGYAFCKAHSTAYGVEAYQSAWVKRYFPAEFMAAVLTHGKGFYHPLVYVLECHRLGIPLLPPTLNQPGPAYRVVRQADSASSPSPPQAIRVPLRAIKGLTERMLDRLLASHGREAFASLGDFYRRVTPSGDELDLLLRAGAFDEFGKSRTAQYWEARHLLHRYGSQLEPGQGWLFPPAGTDRLPEVPLSEPTRFERLKWEQELLDFTASAHPLELYPKIAWNTYCPISQLAKHLGEQVITCGLVIEQRLHHQVTGEPMKFLTLADWTGMAETELFAPTYRSYGLATVRYPVLEITASVEPFENGRGYTLRVHRAGKPRLTAN